MFFSGKTILLITFIRNKYDVVIIITIPKYITLSKLWVVCNTLH